jgi:hypothetical protein
LSELTKGQVVAVQGLFNSVAGDTQLGVYRMLHSHHDQRFEGTPGAPDIFIALPEELDT